MLSKALYYVDSGNCLSEDILTSKYSRRYSTQVVIAALNEEQGIGLTIQELQKKIDAPVLVVDGNSTDKTVIVAKKLGAKVILQDGTGKGNAVAKALSHTSSDVEYIVLTDADYTYSAEKIPEMIKILEENPKIGMVCGNRFNGHIEEKAFNIQFYLGNKILAIIHSIFNEVSLQDPLTGLRVVRAEILRNWKPKSEGFDIEIELNILVEKRGFKTAEVHTQYRQRIGEKKLKMKHGITILKRILIETVDKQGK
jgi:dolichol-phosphate hexosyltransferase